MKTPNQAITKQTTFFFFDGRDSKSLEPASIVKAVGKQYLPEHCQIFDDRRYVAVYSKFGLGYVYRDCVNWDF